jgi:16S rRNA A1518/A1519 N6-dimethyltransferase RsmA/KsgA/DIM1 with predicted DNA glycosylase/AP lyase activity
MAQVREPRLTFGEAADLYDKHRPEYPAEVFARIFDAANIKPSDGVLEVGAGIGKASIHLAQAEVRLTCVEPDSAMAAVLNGKLTAFDNASVAVSDFEDWKSETRSTF